MNVLEAANALQSAHVLAKEHRIRIVISSERADPAVPGTYVTVYQVFTRTGYQGKRRDPAELLTLVKRLAKNFT